MKAIDGIPAIQDLIGKRDIEQVSPRIKDFLTQIGNNIINTIYPIINQGVQGIKMIFRNFKHLK